MQKYLVTLLSILSVGLISASGYEKIELLPLEESLSHQNIYEATLLPEDVSIFKEQMRPIAVESALLFKKPPKKKIDSYSVFSCEEVYRYFNNDGSGSYKVKAILRKGLFSTAYKNTSYFFHDTDSMYIALIKMIFTGDKQELFSEEELLEKKLEIYRKVKNFYARVNEKIYKNSELVDELNWLGSIYAEE